MNAWSRPGMAECPNANSHSITLGRCPASCPDNCRRRRRRLCVCVRSFCWVRMWCPHSFRSYFSYVRTSAFMCQAANRPKMRIESYGPVPRVGGAVCVAYVRLHPFELDDCAVGVLPGRPTVAEGRSYRCPVTNKMAAVCCSSASPERMWIVA